MKLAVIAKGGQSKKELTLPKQFNEKVRIDIIKRAVESEQSSRRQPYGASPLAGLKHTSYVSKRRHDYKTTYGIGQSRTPRKVMSRSGSRMNWVGATVPQTVGGRRAHPPKAQKIWAKRINQKEKMLAIRSAMSATIIKDIVKERGHKVPDAYPFIIDNEFQGLARTKDVASFLSSLGFDAELERSSEKKVRAGRGKMRGRRYKKKKGPLIVSGSDCALIKAARNVPGVDVVKVEDLTVELLAPGTMPGRVTLWTEEAIIRIQKENMIA